MARKLIIDLDPGIGDALAVVAALQDPELDVVALTATAGCVSAAQATRNLQVIVDQVDPQKWPRLGAASETGLPFSSTAGEVLQQCALLHGMSGLGERDFAVAELHHRHESAKLIIDLVRSEPHEITLLTLGPLTNVAVACERFPEFPSLLGNLVCLGGSVSAGGDANAAAEFNMFADPRAARDVLQLPATKTLIPLDLSDRVVLTFDRFNHMRVEAETPTQVFLCQLLSYYFRAHHEHLGLEGIPMRELVALASISQPRLFESEPMAVDVETRGELTRGMTVFDRRGALKWSHNIDVLTSVDMYGVLDYAMTLISQA